MDRVTRSLRGKTKSGPRYLNNNIDGKGMAPLIKVLSGSILHAKGIKIVPGFQEIKRMSDMLLIFSLGVMAGIVLGILLVHE